LLDANAAGGDDQTRELVAMRAAGPVSVVPTAETNGHPIFSIPEALHDLRCS